MSSIRFSLHLGDEDPNVDELAYYAGVLAERAGFALPENAKVTVTLPERASDPHQIEVAYEGETACPPT
jgi:hypothetical protein